MHTGFLIRELLDGYGVRYVFGVPGGQTYPLYDALHRSTTCRHILVRDERSGAYAAEAYARVTNRIGVCDATVGPGAIKLLSGAAEAYGSSVPLLGLISNVPSNWLDLVDRGTAAQGVEQLSPFQHVAKWTHRVASSERLPAILQQAMLRATSGRPGPVILDIPADVFKAPYVPGSHVGPPSPALASFPSVRTYGNPAEIRAAITELAEAERPLVIAGGGALLSQAWQELRVVAERLGIPVATTISGKGIFPETHSLSVGIVGSQYGSSSANAAQDEADVILLIGYKTSQQSTAAWMKPDPRRQRLIQIDIDPAELGKVFIPHRGIAADAKAALGQMAQWLDDVRPVHRGAWLARIREMKAAWESEIDDDLRADDGAVKPQQVIAALDGQIGPRDIVVTDASFCIGWAALYHRVREAGRTCLFPRGNSSLGYGLPAAIGAQLGAPGRRVVCVAGDGGFTYAIGELSTLVKYGLPVVSVILNNSCLSYTQWEEKLDWQGSYESSDLPVTDFARIAEGFGCLGFTVDHVSALADTLREALAAERPAVVDVKVDRWETPVTAYRNALKQEKRGA